MVRESGLTRKKLEQERFLRAPERHDGASFATSDGARAPDLLKVVAGDAPDAEEGRVGRYRNRSVPPRSATVKQASHRFNSDCPDPSLRFAFPTEHQAESNNDVHSRFAIERMKRILGSFCRPGTMQRATTAKFARKRKLQASAEPCSVSTTGKAGSNWACRGLPVENSPESVKRCFRLLRNPFERFQNRLLDNKHVMPRRMNQSA